MPSRRFLASIYCAVLVAFSVTWMVLVRVQPPVFIGVETRYLPRAQKLEITSVVPHGPADQAGLKTGDAITHVDGAPLSRLDPFYDARRKGNPGQVVRLRVEGDGGREVPVTLLSREEARARNLVGQPNRGFRAIVEQVLTLYPLPFLLVAVVVLLQRPDDPNAWLLALMLGSFITSAPAEELEYQLPALARGPFMAFWFLLRSLLPALTYFFFSVFPAHSPLDRRVPWLKHAIMIVALGPTVPISMGMLAAGGMHGLWAVAEWLGPNLLSAIQVGLTIYSIAFFLGIVSLALNAFGEPDVRRKSRVILLGMLVACLPLVVMQITISMIGIEPGTLPFPAWATAIISLFAVPVSLGYAVVKHRAMEIPVLLRRSARYVLVRRGLETLAIVAGLIMTGVFARVVDRALNLPAEDRTSAGLIAGSLFGGFLALAGRRMWQPAAERLDRAFFRSAYDTRRLLLDLAEQSRTTTDRQALAEMIDHVLVQALHPKTLTVYLRGGDDWTFEAAAHEGLVGSAARLPATPSQLQDLARRGRPLLIDPVRLDPMGAWGSLAPLHPEALVPLVGRSGQLEGLLVLGPRLSEEPYSGEDVAMLGSVGTQAGLALENIRLAESMAARIEAERRVHRELEIARGVQSQLLPQRQPQIATLDCAGRCIQARIVGGDYFDFLPVGSGQVGLVLADISGKGISAALLMASLQANLRAQYVYAVDDMSRVLCTVNQIFYASTAANHYATLFFGLYDEPSRRLRYANCGHLPPILVRASGCVERLQVTAPVVGLFEPWECGTGEVPLDPGDLLVVFTDGVSEALSEDEEEFGEERLVELLTRQPHGRDATAVLDEIVQAVRTHSGRNQYDDLTLLVARAR